jgi:hypothetical protein
MQIIRASRGVNPLLSITHLGIARELCPKFEVKLDGLNQPGIKPIPVSIPLPPDPHNVQQTPLQVLRQSRRVDWPSRHQIRQVRTLFNPIARLRLTQWLQ